MLRGVLPLLPFGAEPVRSAEFREHEVSGPEQVGGAIGFQLTVVFVRLFG